MRAVMVVSGRVDNAVPGVNLQCSKRWPACGHTGFEWVKQSCRAVTERVGAKCAWQGARRI